MTGACHVPAVALSVMISTVDTRLFTFTGIEVVLSITALKVKLPEPCVKETPGAFVRSADGGLGKVKITSTDWPVGA